MQRMPHRDEQRPSPLKTHSFSRLESPSAKSTPHDPASILASGADDFTGSPVSKTPDAGPERSHTDIFDTQDDSEPAPAEDATEDGETSNSFEQLPVEIQSLMERFLESLSLKSSSAALSIDRLAELYQDFYVHVEGQIGTHIAALSSRIAREKSPAPSTSSVGSGTSGRGARRSTRDRPPARRQESEQQLLTASEVADRRKARRQLEVKRLAMEEAVERGVCERVYPRLWRHSSTDDESRDAKLRSRAAALSVVGVDLKELLSSAMTSDGGAGPDSSVAANSKNESVHDKLAEARSNLEQMNDDRYPQAKLQRLSTLHKNIVESLSEMFPSSSSADEILPTLIYVIILSDPKKLSVVSNLLFIQRFRNQAKVDGEAAYCLTNLEAAISFLETVDLSSIRKDELPQGPHRRTGSQPSTPKSEKSNPMYQGMPLSPPQSTGSAAKSPTHARRLSNLLGAKPTNPLEAATGAVDSARDAMHNALDGSFKFLFGRIRERQATQSPVSDAAAPKTLEDARKLVTQEENRDLADDDDEDIIRGEMANPAVNGDASTGMLELVGGKRATARDQSTTSDRGKKVAFLNGSADTTKPDSASITSQNSSGGGSNTPVGKTTGYDNAVEQMRNFSNSFNPLNYKGFTMRGFGRNVTPTPSPAPSATAVETLKTAQVDGASANENSVASRGEKQGVDISGIAPPIARFVELKEAKELNGFDVELLLRDYQRLAGALKSLKS